MEDYVPMHKLPSAQELLNRRWVGEMELRLI